MGNPTSHVYGQQTKALVDPAQQARARVPEQQAKARVAEPPARPFSSVSTRVVTKLLLTPESPHAERTLILEEKQDERRPVTVRGTVVDANDRLLSGVAVETPRLAGPVGTVTDANGQFALTSQLPKQVGYIYLTFDKKDFAQQKMRLKADVIPDPLEVRMEEGRWLAGALVDQDNRPVPNASIGLLSTRFKGFLTGTRRQAKQDGTFRLDNLSSEQLVSIWSPIHAPVVLHEQYFEKDDLLIMLKAWGIVQGNVFDAGHGQPIPRFNIKVYPPEDLKMASTLSGIPTTWGDMGIDFSSTAGAFQIEGLATDNDISLVVTAEGYEPRVLRHVAVEGRETAPFLECRLYPSTDEVFGRVADSQGRSRPGIEVYFDRFIQEAPIPAPSGFSMDSPSRFLLRRPTATHTITNADGEFRLLADRSNGGRLFFFGENIPDYQQFLPSTASGFSTTVIPEQAILIGTFSPPVPPNLKLHIEIKHKTERGMRQARFLTGGSDGFTMWHLYPGSHDLTIKGDSNILLEQEIILPEGEVTRIDLDPGHPD